MRPHLILLVEDNLDNYSMLRDYLHAKGYITAAVSSVEEAREFLQQARPDLILLDVMLPGETGLALMAWLRRQSALASIPVIIQTALVLPHEQSILKQVGAAAVLTKPYSLRKLIQVIEHMTVDGNGAAKDAGP
jgi:CheY-like chemotaxis protein